MKNLWIVKPFKKQKYKFLRFEKCFEQFNEFWDLKNYLAEDFEEVQQMQKEGKPVPTRLQKAADFFTQLVLSTAEQGRDNYQRRVVRRAFIQKVKDIITNSSI